VVDAASTDTSFTDRTALTAETEYSYALFAHDSAPGYAAAAGVTTTTTAVPGPVTSVGAAPASGSIVLSWTNPVSATLSGVVIRRAAGAIPPATVVDGTLVVDAGGSDTSFTDRTALTAETQYSYSLFAHDATPGYAEAATLTTSTAAVPGPVTSVSANPDGWSVDLSWTNPASATLSGVVIRRAPGAIPPASVTGGTLVGDTGGSATSFTDGSALTPETQYSYALFAHDATPGYAPSGTVTVTTAPRPVTNVSAAPASGSVVLSWTNPASATFTGVVIRRAPGATPPASVTDGTLVVSAGGSATSFTDRTALSAETEYSYALFAHDGRPGYAVAATLTTSTTAVPGPVTSVGANPASGSVVLSWTNPLSATLSGVVIRRAPGSVPPATVTDGTLVGDAGGSATTFTDRTALTPVTEYSYALFAHDATPGFAAAATLTTSTTPLPGPVTSPGAIPDGRTILLSWANPTSPTFTGVMIRRAKGAIPPATVTDGTLVVDAGGSATSFTDAGRRPMTRYSYSFFAHDATPGYSVVATASATTAASPGDPAFAWGSNATGQLGDGTTTTRRLPVEAGTGTEWVSASAGGGHTVAIKADGTMWAWGDNEFGQLGDGTTDNRTAPTQVGTGGSWKTVAAGGSHTVAVRSDGTLWSWGFNGEGELGDNTQINHSVPLQVGTDTSWASVSAGNDHTLAIRTDGTLWAWGDNAIGQLGCEGSLGCVGIPRATEPVQVGTDTGWASVAAGYSHTVAVRTDGTLWAWGLNYNGQLGDGSNTSSSAPVQVGTDSNWASATAGSYHTAAVKSNGTLWSWGYNEQGELGDSTTIDRTEPVQVGEGADWASVTAGYSHTVALTEHGTLWAWGDNSLGQLGDGTVTGRLAPAQVGTDNDWVWAAAGKDHTVALRP
jgi:alpha-tubulin suppressor-like RCC1 family protein